MPPPPTSTDSRPPRSPLRIPAIIAGVVVTVVVLGAVFALGRWSADAPTPAGPLQPSVAQPPPEPLVEMPAPPLPRPAPAASKPAAPPPPVPSSTVTPELVTRVTEVTKQEIEKLRPYIVSRCWPAGGLAGGQQSTKLTFKITFDAQGREIARGLSEDRSAPAGEFGSCLMKLEGTTLSVQPPGANVGVSVPMTFP